jgi:tryptophan-rich sensory protein
VILLKKINIKHLAINLGISLGTGILAGLFSMMAMDNYKMAKKPPLTPPNYIFPIVWAILFILMGISSYIIYESESDNKLPALTVYGIQLGVNFLWPLLFFNMSAYLFSLIWIVLLWFLIIVMILMFYSISKIAAYLQIPYLLWVTFATYLNLGIFLLN